MLTFLAQADGFFAARNWCLHCTDSLIAFTRGVGEHNRIHTLLPGRRHTFNRVGIENTVKWSHRYYRNMQDYASVLVLSEKEKVAFLIFGEAGPIEEDSPPLLDGIPALDQLFDDMAAYF